MNDRQWAGPPEHAGPPQEQSEDAPHASAGQEPLDRRVPEGMCGGVSGRTISRISGDEPAPLSSAQERLWFLNMLEPESPAYNRLACFQITGRLDAAILERSFCAIVRRHEILRTNYPARDGKPVAIVLPALSQILDIQDYSRRPGDTGEAAAADFVRAEARRSFDLSRGPLLRTTLMRLTDTEYWLLVAAHHIIFDSWSEKVMLDELAQLYSGFSAGRNDPLPDLPIQYRDFAHWQRERLQGPVLAPHLEYWRRQLSGSPSLLRLRTDYPRPGIRTARGERQSVVLAPRLCEALRQGSRGMGVTLFMLLVAAFKVLLYRITGQDDILVGFPSAGRTYAETEPLIGLFVNTLVLRSRLSGTKSFDKFLAEVRETVLGALEHQDAPFEMLVREMRTERNLGFSPLFQIFFNFRNLPRPSALAEGIRIEKLGLDTGISQFDVSFEVMDSADGLSCTTVYNADLFAADTIARLLGWYETLLQGLVQDPGRTISWMPLVPEAERRRLLVDWNDTGADYPNDACIHQLFQRKVRDHPHAIAAWCAGRECTYGELNQQANRLAHHLRKRQVGPGVIVGLLLDRSFDLLAGMLGILKAGGVCLPLDPDYPEARLASYLREANARMILTESKRLITISPSAVEGLCLDRDSEILRLEPETDPEICMDPGQPAYVFFTSGSTGVPNGVLMPHRGIVNALAFMARAYGIGSGDTVLQLASPSFDASIREMIGPLTAGARVVLLKDGQAGDPAAILETMASQQVTCLVSVVPSLLRMLSETAASRRLPALRLILSSGENLYYSDCRKARAAFGSHVRLVNQYGPTETTMICCYHPVDVLPETDGVVPIGRPIANCRLYVLDPEMNPSPMGIPGELYIGGVGVTLGYLNDPVVTGRKFLRDPWVQDPGARIYESGDLVRYRPDGNLEILGRLDCQAKIRGCRVEVEEVEAAIRRHRQVKEAAVIVSGEDSASPYLAAYFVPMPGFHPAAAEWRRYLGASLPGFMIPSVFVALDALPLTANGKVDRNALPAQRTSLREEAVQPLRPRNPLESELVRIWEEALGVHPIGIGDDFFELGGHSLLAASLIAQIERACGVRLPLATLFGAPTIELLAECLRREHPASGPSLVAIRSHGTGHPVYWVHTYGGHILLYQRLARYLPSDRPMYALQPAGIDDDSPPHTSIEDMAAHYLGEIRAVQPAGPYWLGGQSFGGLVAYEMACQLRTLGETVARLFILDTYAPGGDPVASALRRRALRLSRWFDYHRVNLRMMPARRKPAYLMERLTLLLVNLGLYPSKNLDRIIKIHRAQSRARIAYAPPLYPGRITLFRARRQPLAGTTDLQSGWGRLAAQGVEVHEVAGSHSSMIVEPHVSTLAAELQACLDCDAITDPDPPFQAREPADWSRQFPA